METKTINIPFEIKNTDQEDPDFFFFKGHGAVFGNIDSGDDIILKGAFNNTLGELKAKNKNLPVLFMHDNQIPLGVFIDIKEDEKGIFVHGKLPKNDSFVIGRIIPQMKVGSISEMSIGFSVVKGSTDDNGIRVLKELKLMEISLVVSNMAMNEQALITEMKNKLSTKDNETKGKSLASLLNSLIDKQSKDNDERQKLLEKVASAGGIEKGTLNQILNADIVCPPLKRLEGFASALNVATSKMVDAAKLDGCMYDEKGLKSCAIDSGSHFKLDNISQFNEREFEKKLKGGVSFSNKSAKLVISALKSIDLFRDEAKIHRDDDDLANIVKELKSLTHIINGGK